MTCAVIVQKEEANLVEWARWHLLACGFDALVMFCDGKRPELPDDVARKTILVDAPSGGFQAVQFASYNAFMIDFSARFSAAMFIDADEYLNLHGAAVGEWLERAPKAPVHSFNWVMYGSVETPGFGRESLAKRFRMRAAGPDRHVKPLLDLDACREFRLRPVFFNAHCAHGNCPGGIIPSLAAVGRTHVGPFSDVSFDPAGVPYVAHYYAKTDAEFEEKLLRGRPDYAKDHPLQYWNIRGDMEKTRAGFDRNDEPDPEIALRCLELGI